MHGFHVHQHVQQITCAYLGHVVKNINGVTTITATRVIVKWCTVEECLTTEHDILPNTTLFNLDAILLVVCVVSRT